MFYINGSYLDETQAKISVLDLGLIRGYGIFDYLRTYQGRPFHLWDHLLRLSYSAKEIGLSLPHTLEEIEKKTLTLLEKSPYSESSIKIIVTGGSSPDQITPQNNSSLIIHVYPLKPYPEQFYTQGIKTTTTMLTRSIPTSKTIQYIPAIMALQKAREKDAQEALYLNLRQEILEATTSNFFAFKGNTLITPSSHEVLLGITREVILNLAKDHFHVEIRPISYSEIPTLDETFVSASNKEIMPVVQIDDQIINKGKVGPNTKHLMQMFADYTKQPSWELLDILRYRA